MLQEHDFELVWRGYDQAQVRRCIDDLNRRLETALAGLDAAARLETELYEAHVEIQRLRAATQDVPYLVGDRISTILNLAEEQAERVRAQAERDAEEIRGRALAEATAARREFEANLRARREREQARDTVLRTISV